MLELINVDARLLVDADNGGRIASLTIAGFEVLVTQTDGAPTVSWGSFPMAPWAGRIRHGEFLFEGRPYSMPINFPPHAIHGTAFERSWNVAGPREITVDFGAAWPFGGRAIQRFALTPTRLHCTLEIHADEQPMPAYLGWHPWFVKPDSLEFAAESMFIRDADGLPDGTMATPPPPPPWDDCFAGVTQPVTLRWGSLELRVSSDCEYWVIYDQPEHATCVEPQSGPPDGFTLEPFIVEPNKPLVKRMTWDWA